LGLEAFSLFFALVFMRRLRIAYAMINCNRSDGSARALNELAERVALKHEVHLFARTAEEIDLSQIKWHRVPGLSWPAVVDFTSYHLLAEFIIPKRRFDIIHSVGPNARAANVITIPQIQPAKSEVLLQQPEPGGVSLPRKFTRWLHLEASMMAENRTYTQHPGARPPLFLPCSRGVEKELRKHYDIGAAPVRVVPNAADTKVFKPLEEAERQRWRQANGFQASDIILIFAGGEWIRKGLDIAIGALSKLHSPNVKLFVAGADAELSRFKALASELGVVERVVFGGFRRDVQAALGAADIFFFPSRYEAFSLAIIEAAACGLPLVTTSINGSEDFITPGKNGYFVEHDAEQAAKVLEPLIDNAELRKTLGDAAWQLVKSYYTWDHVAEMTESAYFEYLEQYPVPIFAGNLS
jgi:glycosyltransferase involved in cell wall biosynthesis